METKMIPQVMGDEGLKAARKELREFLVGLKEMHGVSVVAFVVHGGQTSEAVTDDMLEAGEFQTAVYLNAISRNVVQVINREGDVALIGVDKAIQLGMEQFLETKKIADGPDVEKYLGK